MRSIIRILFLAVLAAVAHAAPVAAQGFVYRDIAWGSDPQTTTEGLAQAGFEFDAENSEGLGELLYTSTEVEGAMVFATFSADRLVGIRIVFSAENVDELFETSMQERVEALGEPDEVEEGMATWIREDTDFSLMLNETDSGFRYMAAQYAGPGFHEEVERRMAAEDASRPLPALESRWTVVVDTDAYRAAFDRTTIQPQGNRVFRVWMRNDYGIPQDEPVEHDMELDQLDYDCAGRRFRAVAATFQLEGRLVHSTTPETVSAWVPVPPESLGETLITAVCQAAERR